MPTLVDLDGFSHQTKDLAQAGSGFIGMYDTTAQAANCTFDTAIKRTNSHVCSLKVVMAGAATGLQRTITGTQSLVASFYFRAEAAPSAASQILFIGGPTNKPTVQVTNTGGIRVFIGGSGVGSTSSNMCDGLWHLIDVYLDTSATTYTVKLTIDGTVITSSGTIGSQVAANMTSWRAGSNSTDTFTFWMQDVVISATLGDYPIGHHIVLPLYPSGEGTETLGSSNKIQDESAGQTNLYQKVNDWNGSTPDTAHYVTYASTTTGDAASNFAEFTLDNPGASSSVWDVLLVLAGFAANTAANTADLRLLASHGGATIDSTGLLDYSGSTSALGFHRKVSARPGGGWTVTALSNAVLQWGFATDTNPLPRLSAAMLEYAAPQNYQSVNYAATGTPAAKNATSKAVAYAATATAAIARACAKPVAYAATATAAIARSAGKLISYAASATAAIARSCGKAVSRTITGTPIVARAVGKVVSYSATATAAISRAIAKTIDAYPAGAPQGGTIPAVTRSTAKTVSRTITGTVAAAASRAYSILVNHDMFMARAHHRVTSKTVNHDMFMARAHNRRTSKTVAASSTLGPFVSRIRTLFVTRAVTLTTATTLGRAFARTFAISMPSRRATVEEDSPRLAVMRLGRSRLAGSTRSTVVSSSTVISGFSSRLGRARAGRTRLGGGEADSTTTTSDAGGNMTSVSRLTGKNIPRDATVAAAVSRLHPRLAEIAATLTTAAARSSQVIVVAIAAVSTDAVAVSKQVGKAVGLVASTAFSVVRRTSKPVAYALSATTAAFKRLAQLVTLAVTMTVSVDGIKAFFHVVTLAITAAPSALRSTGKAIRAQVVAALGVPRVIGLLLDTSATLAGSISRAITKRAFSIPVDMGPLTAIGYVAARLVALGVTLTAEAARGIPKRVSAVLTATPRITRTIALTFRVTLHTFTKTLRRRVGIIYRLVVAGFPFTRFSAGAPEDRWKAGWPER